MEPMEPDHSNHSRAVLVSSLIVIVALAGLVTVAMLLWSSDVGALRKIVVTSEGRKDSEFWQLAVFQDGRYSETEDVDTVAGRLPFRPVANRIQRILRSPFNRLVQDRNGRSLSFWVEGSRGVNDPTISVDGVDHPGLRRFAQELHRSIIDDQRRINAAKTAALRTLARLRSAIIVSEGCYGDCPRYTLRLSSNGIASLTYSTSELRVSRSSKAVIDWPTMRARLRAIHIERLNHDYRIFAVDTLGGRADFQFPTYDYSVNAPDSTAWPNGLRQLFDVARHTLLTGAWQPRLDPLFAESVARDRAQMPRGPRSAGTLRRNVPASCCNSFVNCSEPKDALRHERDGELENRCAQ